MLEGRLVIINLALNHIANVKTGIEDEDLIQRLAALERTWQQRGSNTQLELEMLRHRLREEQVSSWTMIHQGLLNFVTGRGVILVLAFFAAGSVFFLMQTLPPCTREKGSTRD